MSKDDTLTTCSNDKNMSSRLYRNSEAFASKFLETISRIFKHDKHMVTSNLRLHNSVSPVVVKCSNHQLHHSMLPVCNGSNFTHSNTIREIINSKELMKSKKYSQNEAQN